MKYRSVQSTSVDSKFNTIPLDSPLTISTLLTTYSLVVSDDVTSAARLPLLNIAHKEIQRLTAARPLAGLVQQAQSRYQSQVIGPELPVSVKVLEEEAL